VKKIKIALDVDGVLCSFVSGALDVVEEVTGKRFAPEDIAEFDITKALGLSECHARAVKDIVGSCRGFCAALPPYPGARQGVRRLRELGEVFCVTTPWDSNLWWRSERESWLALHFGIDVVHHADDKRPYEADVFVDDRAKHVRAWGSAWPGRAAVFWRTPHNMSEAVPAGAHSISSWDALYDIARETALGPRQLSMETVEVAP
jgi:5'(3')-deoxyribonucleotidase